MDTAQSTGSLAVIYADWEVDHHALAQMIAPLTPEQLGLRAAPHLRTVNALVCHIVAARARMTHWILRDGPADLDALAYWDGFDQPAPPTIRPASELVDGLEATWRAIEDFLTRWTVADLDQLVQWTYQGETQIYIRQRGIWNLVRHDYHHGGELALTLGIHGIPTHEF